MSERACFQGWVSRNRKTKERPVSEETGRLLFLRRCESQLSGLDLGDLATRAKHKCASCEHGYAEDGVVVTLDTGCRCDADRGLGVVVLVGGFDGGKCIAA